MRVHGGWSTHESKVIDMIVDSIALYHHRTRVDAEQNEDKSESNANPHHRDSPWAIASCGHYKERKIKT